jgi:SAM-dependent methyltransferase
MPMARDETARADRWEARYQAGDLPWDSSKAEMELLHRLDEIALAAHPSGRARGGGLRAIDLGCGTGTNAIELCKRGFEVTACDISGSAIEQAKAKASAAGAGDITFAVADILEALPVEAASVDLAFDRGCLHSVDGPVREVFAANVAAALKPGGWWVLLAGNKDDDPKYDQPGPPQMTATQIAAITEPWFEVHDLRRIRLTNDGEYTHLAWSALLRRREERNG